MVATFALAAMFACDRNMEPYVPGEEPRQPDLSRIFPAGAEQAAAVPELAPSPQGGRGAAPVAAGNSGAPPVGADGAPIQGTVVVADALADRLPQGAVLFVVARRGSAGPPTAVKRVASPRFPFDFVIGPADRMIATMPFEGPLTITARLDGDGNATTRQPGDLQGAVPTAVAPGANGLLLTLDEVL